MEVLEKVRSYASENRIAIRCDGEDLTYTELEEKSNAMAKYFLDNYNEDRTPIVIYGNKDNLIIILMLAALKSGRAYIPLDVTFPKERVKDIVKEVKAKIVINFTEVDLGDNNCYSKNEIEKIINKYGGNIIDRKFWVKDNENAYILFTSGSTGKPKGVQISANNLNSFISWFAGYLNIDTNNDVIMNQVSYSFDVSVIPIYIGLINGKTLYSLSKKTLEDFKVLFKALNESNIKTWVTTPALAEMCIKDNSFNNKLMPKVDTFFFAGEVLTKKLVVELKKRFPGVRIINGYGPTEGTVLLTAIDITDEMIIDEKSIPIGYPLENGVLKIVNENGNEVEDGEKGELIAISKSISKGYFNNESKTNEVFFDEVINGEIIRGYRTGDLTYYNKGVIYYCGRKDFQIKLNGFRIELEDIENNLRKIDNVNNAVVLPVYKDEKISHLVAFITLKKSNGLSSLKNSIAIKNKLKDYIPAYMIPRNIKTIDEFPININGKIDRKALMEDIK
ncbi:D-alanine--poly(phosphoribitol) ligase subunit DltA [Clostridium sp. D53t1_180928_C8]|uniref:D-alanine--poly(phosphoribitol) ligase subunit DltA n=1 Tax=Clostridium sp. D53t1_180928_C8 TaxID=2787101 RepID=UPI0018A9C004|nr:D-alanine--poly(phosphoribitol) ligase subunit DltA [Clostridium sp. D53t1_180928_C8]